LDQGLAEEDTGNKGKRAQCKPSRDLDSRKLFPAVMLNQGSTERRHGRKKGRNANRTDIHRNRTLSSQEYSSKKTEGKWKQQENGPRIGTGQE
jgi:hypothetical protein